MATFIITAPDGRKFKVSKEGATRQQALEHVRNNADSLPELETATKASASGPLRMAGMAATPEPPAEPRKQHDLSTELFDVAKSGMAGVARGGEFLTDVANLPWTLGERHEHGMQATAERESYLPRLLGGGFENYLAGAFGTPTERGKQISDMFDIESTYKSTIPEDEGSRWREPAEKFLGLSGELGVTSFMGGYRAAPLVTKSIPTSAALGTAGEALYGDAGELGGVIAGALAHDPKAIAQLLNMVEDRVSSGGMAFKKAAVQAKRKLRSGDTLETASNEEIRAGLRETLRNMTGPDGGALDSKTINELIPKLEVALTRGEQGTVAQIIDNPGLRQFEKDQAVVMGREAIGELGRIDANINRGALETVEAIAPEGVAAEAPAFPKTLADEARREAGEIPDVPRRERLDAAKAEEEARAPFTLDDKSQRDTGRTLASSVDAIKQQEFNAVKKKWAALDAVEQTIPADQLRDKYARDLTEALKGDDNLVRSFEADFPNTAKRIAELEGDVSIAALSDVLSLLSKESVGTSTNPAVIEAVKDSLYSTISKGSKRRQAAAKAHREYMEKWGPKTTVGRSLKGEPEDFGVAVITTGPKGATRLNTLLENAGPEVRGQAQDVLRSRFRDEVMDADGNINPSKAATFERKYREHLALEGMEDLRSEVSNASARAAALRDSTDALKRAEQASTKAIADVEKSDIAILGSTGQTDDEVAKAVRDMLKPGKGRDVTAELGTLMKQIEGNPQATANVRRALADDFMNSVTDKGVLSQDSYSTFKRRRKMYEESGAFTADELDRIDKQFTEGQKLFLGEDGKRFAKLPKEQRRVAEAVAALAGAKIGANLFGSPLIGAALGRKFAVDKLHELSDDKAAKLAFELTTNPDKFVEWTKILNSPSSSSKDIDNALVKILETATVATRTVPLEDE